MLFRLLILVIQLKKTDYNTKTSETENKKNDHDHTKYITTQEFNKLTAQVQANLASKNHFDNFKQKTDFDDRLININKKLTLNKIKHALAENEANKLSKKLKQYQQNIAIFF